MDDCHLSDITKLEKETLSQSASFSDGVGQGILAKKTAGSFMKPPHALRGFKYLKLHYLLLKTRR